MQPQPKYSLCEIERRWLVPQESLKTLQLVDPIEIEDRYITESRLRLRKMTSADGDVVYKFCKKYGKQTKLSEPITNLYLSENEYEVLRRLSGKSVRKRRYKLVGGSVDIDENDLQTIVFEIEFESEREAREYVPPKFVGEEITGIPAYSGPKT
jgi:CYTH domain-containing protein